MPKTLLHLALAAAAGLATPAAGRAQQPAKTCPTAAELKKALALVNAGTEGESNAFDSLTTATARQLVAYLKTHEVPAAAAKNLGLGYTAAAGAGHLKVFTYSYASGGTRGTIHRPVLQWQNRAGQLFAYAAHDEGGVDEIHALVSPGRTLYLLLGNEQGSTICVRTIARVVEVKGNFLVMDTNAFGKVSRLDLCNVNMRFDPRNQVLALTGDSQFGLPDVYSTKPFKPSILKFYRGHFVKNK
ncbi:hypothetical protein ACFQ48_17885 [Hymenobacter caeli]|uniref:Uncharacterized protein n=1 Tax=Hymenobacter caeli TaxID=2735894 RepID=A0ABX2FUQ3_9BACT|nr:hypothetical protein [Hymenobacter caeli]NRT20922.1 hypothetical protein [Hymenobacter caeli]